MRERYGRPGAKCLLAASEYPVIVPCESRVIDLGINGPAPMGMVVCVENGNSSLLTFCQICFGRMPSVVSLKKGAYGFGRVKRTVRASSASARTFAQLAYAG